MVAVAEEALVVEPLDVEEPRCSSADAVDMIIQQVLDETRADEAPADTTEAAVDVEKNWFDLPYEDIVKQWEAENPVVTASDTEDEDVATAVVAPADQVHQVEEIVVPFSAEEELSEDEKTSLDDILLSIPVDIPLPSTCMEVTQIKMGQMIKIPGVTQWTWFLKQLPSIPAEDKGKELLEEKDPVRGNPAKEHYSLICADIDLLVSLRAKFIDEVAAFFHSFSLRKLSSINFEEMYNKEDQVLRWGETESPQIAIQRKFYILLKYRTILRCVFCREKKSKRCVLVKAVRIRESWIVRSVQRERSADRCMFCREKKSKRCVLVKAVRIRESWIVRSVQRERSADALRSVAFSVRSVFSETMSFWLGALLLALRSGFACDVVLCFARVLFRR
ncbi:girdin-like [Dorcoceras hygrometricum]|uniref:Girdin-like n=1 Tax=Dorcoceras hygrometricum TaxID=472368 RepID=A0A2Z7A2Q6_9LAMI|nr:girdin-like [Dorcoceras hygrometricum]